MKEYKKYFLINCIEVYIDALENKNMIMIYIYFLIICVMNIKINTKRTSGN